eukprot:29443_1
MAQDPKEATQPGQTSGGSGAQPQSSSDKFKQKMALFGKKAKEAGQNFQQKANARLTMEGQLKQARISLEHFLSPSEVEKQIPVELMRGAKGIVFLSSLKVSVGFGGSIGSGVVISKIDYGAGWSGPCSIGSLGGQAGFNIGAQKTDFIIILRDEKSVALFSGKGQIKFGADASIAAGPIGRDAQIAVGANDKGYAATVSYSMAKGLYVGVALEGQGIAVRNDCNEKFYGEKLKVKDILAAAPTTKNEDYEQICTMITNYITNIPKKPDKGNGADFEVTEDAQEEEGKQPL